MKKKFFCIDSKPQSGMTKNARLETNNEKKV